MSLLSRGVVRCDQKYHGIAHPFNDLGRQVLVRYNVVLMNPGKKRKVSAHRYVFQVKAIG